MDMKEASAMTEASGLTDDQGGIEDASVARRSAETGEGRRPLPTPPSDVAMRFADQLRKLTVKAPLQALFAAFLLGVWVARRR
jgi:hypothetical protein